MAIFLYEAKRDDGAAVKGRVEADDRRQALETLNDQGLFPLQLERRDTVAHPEASAEAVSAPAATASQRPGRRVRRKDVSAFTREMASLLAASIPRPAALTGLGEQEENLALRGVILDLASRVRRGEPLSEAMRAYPKLFDTLYTSIVEVGEEAGALDAVMEDLSDLLESEDELRGEVLGAVAYPAFVLVMGLITTFVLIAFVLPQLFGLLEGMTAARPLSTRILLGVSGFLESYWPWLIGAEVVALFATRAYVRTPAGKLFFDTCKLNLPVVGPLFLA